MGYLTSFQNSSAFPPPTTSAASYTFNAADPASSYAAPVGNVQQLAPMTSPAIDFREVLRFDATPTWVTQHFPQITTVLADMQLDGLRAPLSREQTPRISLVRSAITLTIPSPFAEFSSTGQQAIQLIGCTTDPVLRVGSRTKPRRDALHLQME